MMLGTFFTDVISRYPKNIALVFGDQEVTYEILYAKAQDLIQSHTFSASPFVVIRGERTLEEYIAIAACWISSKPYIPLNPKFSESRCQQILSQLQDRKSVV